VKLGKVFKAVGRVAAKPITVPVVAVQQGANLVMLKVILGIVRHVLTAAGGGLVADGWLSGDDLNTAIGAITTLVGIVWSVWEKRQAKAVAKGVAIVLAAVLVAPALQAAEKDLAGISTVDGVNPDGSKYSSVVEIEARGALWLLTWSHQRGAMVGVGVRRDDVLAVIYSPEGGGPAGLVAYSINGDTLTGTWTIPGDPSTGTESLTKTKNKPTPDTARGPRVKV
jgi:hypothetical protein